MVEPIDFVGEKAGYAVSDEADESYDLIHLDGIPIPVQGRVGAVNLASLPSRLTFGEYTLASDNFLSVWLQSDWTGGGQVEDLREASHAERFSYATADTRYPRMLSQQIETLSFAPTPSTAAAPIGDYDHDNDGIPSFFVAFDTTIYRWDAATKVFVSMGSVATTPVHKGVVYGGILWIPQGQAGYDTYDGTSVTHGTAGITPVDFELWDNKLVALEHDGQVSTWNGSGWDSPPELKLYSDEVPLHLISWWSADRFPTLFVVTNRDVCAVDFIVPVLYRTGLHFPRHPDQGLGAAVWRDDGLYVSVATGVHQLSIGMTISATGLDRDDGLPADLRGRIVDMEPEYNSLFALVEGIPGVSIDSSSIGPTIEETMIYDESAVVPASSTFARASLQRYTGVGWHTAWQSDGASGRPTRSMVSEAEGEYRIWWGYAGAMYTQVLRRTFYNPRQGAAIGLDRFATSSFLQTGRFDANISAFTKLASHVEVHTDPTSSGTITVQYRTDRTDGWQFLGFVTLSGGSQFLSFDPNGDGFAEGIEFIWIEFSYTLESGDNTRSALVNWIALYFTPIPLQSRSWRLLVPLMEIDDQWINYGAREIADFLDSLTTTGRFVTFKHRNDTYRVRVAQTQGDEQTGKDLRGTRTLTLVEVKDRALGAALIQ